MQISFSLNVCRSCKRSPCMFLILLLFFKHLAALMDTNTKEESGLERFYANCIFVSFQLLSVFSMSTCFLLYLEFSTAPYMWGTVLCLSATTISLSIYGRSERLNMSHTFIQHMRQTVEYHHFGDIKRTTISVLLTACFIHFVTQRPHRWGTALPASPCTSAMYFYRQWVNSASLTTKMLNLPIKN